MDTPDPETFDTRALPRLADALWDHDPGAVSGPALLRLYEDRWRYVEPDRVSDRERHLLTRLIEECGNGAFLGR